MDKTKEAALTSLLENFFIPRAGEDATDEVHAEMLSRGPKGEFRFRLSGKRGKYDHAIGEEHLMAFDGKVDELLDFLSSEMNGAVTRYWAGRR